MDTSAQIQIRIACVCVCVIFFFLSLRMSVCVCRGGGLLDLDPNDYVFLILIAVWSELGFFHPKHLCTLEKIMSDYCRDELVEVCMICGTILLYLSSPVVVSLSKGGVWDHCTPVPCSQHDWHMRSQHDWCVRTLYTCILFTAWLKCEITVHLCVHSVTDMWDHCTPVSSLQLGLGGSLLLPLAGMWCACGLIHCFRST